MAESVEYSGLILKVEIHTFSTSAGGRIQRGAHFRRFSRLRISSALKKNH
jgi:hypothetical protein